MMKTYDVLSIESDFSPSLPRDPTGQDQPKGVFEVVSKDGDRTVMLRGWLPTWTQIEGKRIEADVFCTFPYACNRDFHPFGKRWYRSDRAANKPKVDLVLCTEVGAFINLRFRREKPDSWDRKATEATMAKSWSMVVDETYDAFASALIAELCNSQE